MLRSAYVVRGCVFGRMKMMTALLCLVATQTTALMAALASSLNLSSTTEVFFIVLALLLALLLLLTLLMPWTEVWRRGGAQQSFPTCDATNVLFLVSVSVQVTLLGVMLSLRLNMIDNLSWGVLDSASPSAGIHTLTLAYCVMLGIVATCTLCRQLLVRGFCKPSVQFASRALSKDGDRDRGRGAVKLAFPSLWYFCESVGCWCCRRRLRCRGFVAQHCRYFSGAECFLGDCWRNGRLSLVAIGGSCCTFWNAPRVCVRHCWAPTGDFGKYQTVPGESADSRSKGVDPLDSINAHSSWGSRQQRSRGCREWCMELTLGLFGSCCRRM